MGYRVFRDSQGKEWQAWDVIPQLTERREIERRSSAAPVQHADRRRQPDRRVIKGRRPNLTAGLDGGWLCFENDVEKRRLAPIPKDWSRCSPVELDAYLQSAKRVPRMSTSVQQSEGPHTHH